MKKVMRYSLQVTYAGCALGLLLLSFAPVASAGPKEDVHTLISTRGSAFPLTSLEARLKSPLCGSRRVSVIFEVPSEPAAMRTLERMGVANGKLRPELKEYHS